MSTSNLSSLASEAWLRGMSPIIYLGLFPENGTLNGRQWAIMGICVGNGDSRIRKREFQGIASSKSKLGFLLGATFPIVGFLETFPFPSEFWDGWHSHRIDSFPSLCWCRQVLRLPYFRMVSGWSPSSERNQVNKWHGVHLSSCSYAGLFWPYPIASYPEETATEFQARCGAEGQERFPASTSNP